MRYYAVKTNGKAVITGEITLQDLVDLEAHGVDILAVRASPTGVWVEITKKEVVI